MDGHTAHARLDVPAVLFDEFSGEQGTLFRGQISFHGDGQPWQTLVTGRADVTVFEVQAVVGEGEKLGGVGGVLEVVVFNGSDDQGFSHAGAGGHAVGIWGELLEVDDEAVEHGVGENGGNTCDWVRGDADLVSQEVVEEVAFVRSRVFGIQAFVEHRLQQVRQLKTEIAEVIVQLEGGEQGLGVEIKPEYVQTRTALRQGCLSADDTKQGLQQLQGFAFHVVAGDVGSAGAFAVAHEFRNQRGELSITVAIAIQPEFEFSPDGVIRRSRERCLIEGDGLFVEEDAHQCR